MYTQVEQLNKTALKAHGVDPNGQLYKINSFEFYRYEDVIRLTTDPAYDQTAFEKHLEIKGNSDHSKLIKMLDVLNDESSSMDDELFVTYFDKENIAYWMAFQLLTGNTDTQNRNVYLYSPQNSNKWYLWDWDNDGMLRRREREIINFSDSESWERGVSNYWGNVLFRRCLQTQSYRDLLDTAMKELYAYMNEERIQSMMEHYRSVTEKYVWQMPDRMNVPITHDEYEEVLKSIWPEIDENYNYYWESYRKPMPFYIGEPQVVNGSLLLTWDPSYNFEIENIYYTVELAKDYLFTTTFFRQENLILPELTMDTLPAGQYFLRVRATNASGYTQDAFDYYVTEAGKHYGMLCFTSSRTAALRRTPMKMSKPQISMLYHQLLAPPRCTGTEHYRHELKYLISWADKAELTARMSPILKLDPHATNGGYFIRSLYFDDYWNTAYEEKDAGVLLRKKYRIRIYNCSDRSIKLERKKKFGSYIYKEAAPLTHAEFDSILAGDYDFSCIAVTACVRSSIPSVSVTCCVPVLL